jgi:hypothetical protein
LEKIIALKHAWEKCFKKQLAEQRITAAVLGELQGYGFGGVCGGLRRTQVFPQRTEVLVNLCRPHACLCDIRRGPVAGLMETGRYVQRLREAKVGFARAYAGKR